MTIRTKIISYDRRVELFWFLAAACLLSIGLYVYAINATARNAAAHQSLVREMAEKTAELSVLEFSYIELKNEVTMELALEYGFREVRSPLYVSRNGATSLSLNTPSR